MYKSAESQRAKATWQGHSVNGGDGTKISFLITVTIIWLSKNKCNQLLSSEKRGKLKVGQWVGVGNALAKAPECQLWQSPPEVRAMPNEETDTGLGPWWLHSLLTEKGTQAKAKRLIGHPEAFLEGSPISPPSSFLALVPEVNIACYQSSFILIF